jgi:uncharacterized protein (TIGR02466 family)
MKQKLSNSNAINPFPPYIFKYHYDFDWDTIKDKVYHTFDITPNVSALEIGNSKSTLFDQASPPHEWPELSDFFQWLNNPLTEVWNAMNYNWYAKKTGYQNSWFNIHRNGGETLEHQHAYTELVVTCYLQLPKDSGYIEFRDPLEYHKAHTPIVHEKELWKPVPATTGDILIFPGWLKHRTQPNITDDDRIVMTVNVA